MNIWAIRETKLVLISYRPVLILPAVALFLVLLFVVLLVETGYVTSVGYDIQRLDQTKQNWQRDIQLITAEIATASSLNGVERQAKERLKMTPAGSFIYVTLDHKSYDASTAATRGSVRNKIQTFPSSSAR
ncbi:MAG: hypothetical protein EXR50_03820 [Dehalococcoidia bacterium]|nr:hypothetical protein [Dehalococcoidia bacterium]